jgi:hypothetical protein
MLVDFIENTVNRKLGDAERNLVIHGADEVDIVRSGLDDTMTNACAETRKSAMEKVCFLFFPLLFFPSFLFSLYLFIFLGKIITTHPRQRSVLYHYISPLRVPYFLVIFVIILNIISLSLLFFHTSLLVL